MHDPFSYCRCQLGPTLGSLQFMVEYEDFASPAINQVHHVDRSVPNLIGCIPRFITLLEIWIRDTEGVEPEKGFASR